MNIPALIIMSLLLGFITYRFGASDDSDIKSTSEALAVILYASAFWCVLFLVLSLGSGHEMCPEGYSC